MFAIGEDGSLLWQVETGGLVEWAHPVIGPDGTIYVADTRRCPWTFLPIESGACDAWNVTPALYAISGPARRRSVRSAGRVERCSVRSCGFVLAGRARRGARGDATGRARPARTREWPSLVPPRPAA